MDSGRVGVKLKLLESHACPFRACSTVEAILSRQQFLPIMYTLSQSAIRCQEFREREGQNIPPKVAQKRETCETWLLAPSPLMSMSCSSDNGWLFTGSVPFSAIYFSINLRSQTWFETGDTQGCSGTSLETTSRRRHRKVTFPCRPAPSVSSYKYET